MLSVARVAAQLMPLHTIPDRQTSRATGVVWRDNDEPGEDRTRFLHPVLAPS
jgi:hypothetical protein